LGSVTRLHLIKAVSENQAMKAEIVWEKQLGRNVGAAITIKKFEASRTHTYIAYEVTIRRSTFQ
jgi:hypothetical protein